MSRTSTGAPPASAIGISAISSVEAMSPSKAMAYRISSEVMLPMGKTRFAARRPVTTSETVRPYCASEVSRIITVTSRERTPTGSTRETPETPSISRSNAVASIENSVSLRLPETAIVMMGWSTKLTSETSGSSASSGSSGTILSTSSLRSWMEVFRSASASNSATMLESPSREVEVREARFSRLPESPRSILSVTSSSTSSADAPGSMVVTMPTGI